MEKLEALRAATPEALARCLKIRAAVFTEEKGVPPDIENDAFDAIGGECEHYLFLLGGEDAGAARCLPGKNGAVRLQRFCFYKRFRRAGLGAGAMEYLERLYAGRGCVRLELDSKFEVRGFYEKCGYAQTSDIFIEAGVGHVRMEKRLEW